MKKATENGIQKAIDQHEKAIVEILTKEAVMAHLAGDLKAYKALSPIGIDFKLVQKEALDYGKKYASLLKSEGASIIKGKKVAWLADNTERTRADVAQIINDGLKQGKPVAHIGGKRLGKGTIAYDLKQTLIRNKNYEYVRIARTEVGNIQSHASKERYKANNVKKVKWLCGGDPCPICAQYCNKIFDIDEAPALLVHPNCTCDTAPVIER
jgi:SPP1 gp7 family putative phage head morphogenesis protein